MEEYGPHPKAIEYMKKNKLGMWSAADKKAVKENTPPKAKALKKRAGSKVEKHEPFTGLKNRGGEFQ